MEFHRFILIDSKFDLSGFREALVCIYLSN